MNDERGYRKCVRIVIRKGNKVLLGERRYRDGSLMYYDFPGGGIENGDTVIETVKKESLEEVGIVVDGIESLNLFYNYDISYADYSRARKFKGGEDVWYVCDYVGRDHSLHGKEGDALPHVWVDIDEAIRRIKSGPASKYNEARIAALSKVKTIAPSARAFSLATAIYKKPKLSNW